MMRGHGWIAWEKWEAPALPGAKPVKEKPIQEWQHGPNIDSMPVETNPPAPVHSSVTTNQLKNS
jgi:hypothetical protein